MRTSDWLKLAFICCVLCTALPSLRKHCIDWARDQSFRQYLPVTREDKRPKDAMQRAIALCDLIILLQPDDQDAYRARAMFEYYSESYSAAVADYQKQLTMPHIEYRSECLAGLGNALLKMGRTENALKAIHQSASVDLQFNAKSDRKFLLEVEKLAEEKPTFANRQYRAAAVADLYGEHEVAMKFWQAGDDVVLKQHDYNQAQIPECVGVISVRRH